MRRSQKVNALKRKAAVAERKAEVCAASDKPWDVGNMRQWQNIMAWALKERGELVIGYLQERAARR